MTVAASSTTGRRSEPALVEAADAHDGFSVPPLISAAAFGTAPEHCAFIDARYGPHPLATFQQKLVLTGKLEALARRTYVKALRYQGSFTQFQARTDADPSWESATVPSGHFPSVELPEETARILEAAV